MIADGERGALIGPHGEIAWMCAPRWDSDAVFASLIGGGGGYVVVPRGRYVWGGYYEDNALIWRSRWVTDEGVVECREALAFPGDPHRAVVLRCITPVRCDAHMRVVLEPAAGFGEQRPSQIKRDEAGVWHIRVGELWMRWTGAQDASVDESGGTPRLVLDLTVEAGHRHDLILEVCDTRPGEPVRPHEAWRATEQAWHDALPKFENTLAPSEVRLSYAVLRGLTTAGGGMVASATTSLPERAEEGRNYDYRYVWIRDQCYVGQAMAAAGGHPLLDDALRFVTERLHADGARLSPAYTPDGGQIPDQHRLDLPGYPGGYDLIGNQVRHQFQLDALGEALLLFATAARHDRLDDDGRKAARIAAEAIERRWREPDAGIWELDSRHWTHSRLICVAALRSITAERAADLDRPEHWNKLADTILAETEQQALHSSGRWQRAADDASLDGALLLPPVRGALERDDPRTRATLAAYLDELTVDHFAYRFRHDNRPLDAAEGAFVLCGFITALAQQDQGQHAEALRWFERNRAACSATGLFSEEYDVRQRQLRGNLPQAFVHALMIECAAVLAK